MTGKVIEGDYLEEMGKLKAGSIKCIVTSPPYNIGKQPTRHQFGSRMKIGEGYDSHDDDMTREDYVEWQRECLRAMMRLLTPDGAIFYNNKERAIKNQHRDNWEITDGFPLRQKIIWYRKTMYDFSPWKFANTYETIYLIAKPKFKLQPKASGMGSVWTILPERKTPHSAPFPIEIPFWAILAALGKGSKGIVLDPFMGSSTTAVAAEKARCRWLGIENSPKWAKHATERARRANA